MIKGVSFGKISSSSAKIFLIWSLWKEQEVQSQANAAL
jgi:hypothetical protein